MTNTHDAASKDAAAPDSMLALTTKIVAAYISRNATQASELPALIDRVFQSLASLETSPIGSLEAALTPAVPVKRSVFADHIVCLEDGKKLKMLKRHLMASYGMTPEAYRQRWGLPSNYPMVAPNYADMRSTLAKSIGLGRKPNVAAAATEIAPKEENATSPEEQHVAPIPKARGRKLAKAAATGEE